MGRLGYWLRSVAIGGALGLALGAISSAPAFAQRKVSSANLGAKAVALPDWNGIWVIADSFMDKQDGTSVAAPGRFGDRRNARPAQAEPELKGENLARRDAKRKAAAQGRPIDDNGAACLPQGMPNFWGGPYAFEIVQTGRQINLSQEWNEQTRRIYLDGRPHPKDGDPSYNGHSVGHWDGRSLVVDTTGVRSDTGLGLDGSHSDAVHISERLQQTAPDLLVVTMTLEDPKALVKPWVASYRLRRKTGMEIEEYVCEENNRNTVDANGVTQAVIAPK